MQPTTRGLRRGQKTRSAAGIALALVSVTAQMIALAAITGELSAPSRHTTTPVMAAALLQGVACATGHAKDCPAAAAPALAGSKEAERIEVPSGSAPCPNSGAGAACTQAAAPPQAGTSALPAGQGACPADPDKPSLAPGACGPDAAPAAGAAATHVQAAAPSITLTADKTALVSGSTATLVATSSRSVTGTPWEIEIFDTTSRVLIGACAQSSVCTIAYTGKTGKHAFVAYLMTPGQKMPAGRAAASSNRVELRWLGVEIAVNQPAVVAPGKPITFTASASDNVATIGYLIELRDAKSGQRLTFCGAGTTCSTSIVEPTAGTRTVVADLVAQSPAAHANTMTLNASSSGTASGTWLGIDLQSSSVGGVVSFTATANADLSQTPWSIYIESEAGQQVGLPCNASTCSASINMAPNDRTRFRAVIGRVVTVPTITGPLGAALGEGSAPVTRFDLQASTDLVLPRRLVWGVDSCKSYTADPGDGPLINKVAGSLGSPTFWGRYLPPTPNCPGLDGTEIQAAHSRHMGILPIYNDYDCSNVSTNALGSQYGIAAVHWAWNDIIPQGVAIAIDIEPEGDACPGAANVDKGFIEGWFDQLHHAGYVPAFYGNTSGGSAFANAWCAAVAERPEIASSSFVWSFEPSLITGHGAGQAPTWSPNNPGCAGHFVVWQYSLSAGDNPDVDVDLATTEFPFWWP